MLLVPPWFHPIVLKYNYPDGYHWLFYKAPPEDTPVELDVVRLAMQLIAVTVLTSILVYMARKK